MPLLSALPGGAILAALWGFLTSRIGMMLIAAVVAYHAGSWEAEKKCDTARLQAEIATLKADRTTSELAQGLAETQTEALEAKLKANQKRVDDLAADLERRKRQAPETRTIVKTVPGAPVAAPSARDCGLSPADVRRLKEIQ